ncbi:Heme A synthase [Mycobacterium talmoniae]|uniref:Heme A synthase n=1 Tax=Mycobacterium talmoniae TaxID=1858794 RepID=A0A2S8BFX8_9MYCO|nr:Heme A synthase [Mycobacterium talmoniae]
MAYHRAVPVGRFLLRLVDLLPLPGLRAQRLIAAAVILTQGGIAFTGAIVRVTASGLGCPTWPQCFPGSYTPVRVAEVPHLHQAVEFGNRMVTFAVLIAAAAAVLAVTRARRRREVLVYAWLMPASTVVQAVLGGHHRAHRVAVVDGGVASAGVDGDGVAGGAALRQGR